MTEEELDVWISLWSALDQFRKENEERYHNPGSTDADELTRALDAFAPHAFFALTTGQISGDVAAVLADYKPFESVDSRVTELLAYNIAQERLEFDLAESVVMRLQGAGSRIRTAFVALLFLLEAKPSERALQYLARASNLFLAGYEPEAVIMCGAVLEAALSERIPNELLYAANKKFDPTGHSLKYRFYKKTRDFPVGARMQFEEDHPIFNSEQRTTFWMVVNGRNDAVHVVPQASINANIALITVSRLLPVLLPRNGWP